jgi:5-methylcytosine-specific restriction endonuclease McrA
MNTLLRQIARRSSTKRNGSQFDDATIQAVWNKARLMLGANPNAKRMDVCGAVIDRPKYGNTQETGTGWEIDHITPVSRGGTDDLSNLQPLQWQNNRRKGDDYPSTPASYCAVRAARN